MALWHLRRRRLEQLLDAPTSIISIIHKGQQCMYFVTFVIFTITRYALGRLLLVLLCLLLVLVFFFFGLDSNLGNRDLDEIILHIFRIQALFVADVFREDDDLGRANDL